MTQKAATMAMKMRVVWTMGSGMPIVVPPTRDRVVTEAGACYGRGGAAAGVGRAQRCRSDARRCCCSRNCARTAADAAKKQQSQA